MSLENLRGGRYAVLGLLGEGAQGVTYDARDSASGRPVAIKRFDVRGAKGWKEVELAEREARILASLDHPLVPRYIEHFEEEGALYLVMDRVEGETLDALVRRNGPLPEAEVWRFLACADRAFSYLHGRSSPIVHRDVKPKNIVRQPDGSYVFVDFGTVSELLARHRGSTIAGTLGFMAPEQLQGRAVPATDVYAVGATALTALTGIEPDRLPHQGLRLDVRSALAGRASPPMVEALERMLEPDPDRRAPSLAMAIEVPTTSVSAARVAMGAPMPSQEDGVVRSVTKLLWLLWGLSWVIVPVLLKSLPFRTPHSLVPLIMFGSLGVILVATWHRGAVLRHVLRALLGRSASAVAPSLIQAGPRARIAHEPLVRVAASEATHNAYAMTEIASTQRSALSEARVASSGAR